MEHTAREIADAAASLPTGRPPMPDSKLGRPPSPGGPRARKMLYLPQALCERLEQRAQATGQSQSQVVTDALERYLGKREGGEAE